MQAAQTAEQFGQLQSRALFGRADLALLGIAVSDSTLSRWEAAGAFPKRITLGPKKHCRVAWPAEAVRCWLDAVVSSSKGN